MYLWISLCQVICGSVGWCDRGFWVQRSFEGRSTKTTMDDNPYRAPNSSTTADSPPMSLRRAAIRGAKIGGFTGMLLVAVGGVIAGGVVLFIAIRLEMRAQGGFMYAIERLTEGKSFLEVIGGFLAALAVFAGWGAAIGAIALTLSVWSRHNHRSRA
jgi:hypothetical protein